MFEIISYAKEYQTGIDQMMQAIALEFAEPIFSTTSRKIIDFAHLPKYQFWVALMEGQVVGTIGLTCLNNRSVVLRSMFVASFVRGQGTGTHLLNTLIHWCIKHKYAYIYLGTMDQFKAAQHFYKKQEFELIDKNQLPTDFPVNPLDTLFFCKTIQ